MSKPMNPIRSLRLTHLSQRGASLLFALLTLAAMSLAAVALVRSVDTASLVAGNLGFKQASVAITGQAAEAAIARLEVMRASAKLEAVQAGEAYYPTAFENLDVRDRSTAVTRAVVDWNGDGCATPYTAGFANCLASLPVPALLDNRTRYVITRLCAAAGPPSATNYCAKPVNSSLTEGAGRGGLGYPSGRGGTVVDPGPFYRIVVRTVGARNTVSYTETIVHF